MFAFAQRWSQVFSGYVPKGESRPAVSLEVKHASPGRGRHEHTHLQHVIMEWAEEMGWRAAIDCLASNRDGSIDVTLRKGNLSIACEISITTPPDYEVENLRKCLASGYSYVISVSPDEVQLGAIERIAARRLGARELKRVRWFTPWQLVRFVEGQTPLPQA